LRFGSVQFDASALIALEFVGWL